MKMQWVRRTSAVLLAAPLMLAMAGPMSAQDRYQDRRHGDFYNGAYQGGRGGRYDRGHDYRGDRDYRNDNRGGIGPGKGAAIGAAGGAVLGGLFGGGLKGVIIGGAAGAGVGAIAGQAHKDSQRRYYNGRPY